MSAAGILSELAALGRRVVVRDIGPVITGECRGEISPDLLARMKANRDAVLLEVETRAAFDTLAEIMANGTLIRRPPESGTVTTLPPSWSTDRDPCAGASCYCCFRAVWWRYRTDRAGWCCRVCHPPPPGADAVLWQG